jgi:putative phage-type endonuclease
MFDIVELDQGTPEWLRWRQDGIGASEADAIMGRNPWKKPKAVLAEKFRFIPPYRQQGGGWGAAARGTALEPEARAHYQQHTGHAVEPACLQSHAQSWLRASVDGICTQSRRLVEIKCGEKVYAHSASTHTVPNYYLGQLQHILAVTGYDQIDFWCYLPDRAPVLIPIARDEAFIANMLEAEAAFWQQVLEARLAR